MKPIDEAVSDELAKSVALQVLFEGKHFLVGSATGEADAGPSFVARTVSAGELPWLVTAGCGENHDEGAQDSLDHVAAFSK